MNRAFQLGLLVCLTAVSTVRAAPLLGQQPPQLPPAPQHFTRSSVDYFRDLLAMSPEKQQAELAGKSAGYRDAMQKKIAEYAGLTPEERELRLRSTELRLYLKPLMERTPAERVERLQRVPESLRAAVEIRLQQWDKLSPATRQEVLANEDIITYFSRPAVQREQLLASIPKKDREQTEKQILEWEKKSAQDRDRISANFKTFFEWSGGDRQKTLDYMPVAERAEMERALQQFAALPLANRRLCIDSFQKFATMTPKQRDQFLKNTEQWNKMSAEERAKWRGLVQDLPPLPPDFYESAADLPPLPPGFPLFPPFPAPSIAGP